MDIFEHVEDEVLVEACRNEPESFREACIKYLIRRSKVRYGVELNPSKFLEEFTILFKYREGMISIWDSFLYSHAICSKELIKHFRYIIENRYGRETLRFIGLIATICNSGSSANELAKLWLSGGVKCKLGYRFVPARKLVDEIFSILSLKDTELNYLPWLFSCVLACHIRKYDSHLFQEFLSKSVERAIFLNDFIYLKSVVHRLAPEHIIFPENLIRFLVQMRNRGNSLLDLIPQRCSFDTHFYNLLIRAHTCSNEELCSCFGTNDVTFQWFIAAKKLIMFYPRYLGSSRCIRPRGIMFRGTPQLWKLIKRYIVLCETPFEVRVIVKVMLESMDPGVRKLARYVVGMKVKRGRRLLESIRLLNFSLCILTLFVVFNNFRAIKEFASGMNLNAHCSEVLLAARMAHKLGYEDISAYIFGSVSNLI